MCVTYISRFSSIQGRRGYEVLELARYYVGVIGQNTFALIIVPPPSGHISFLVCEQLTLVCSTHMNKISVPWYGLGHSVKIVLQLPERHLVADL